MFTKVGRRTGIVVVVVALLLGAVTPAHAVQTRYIYNTLYCNGTLKRFKNVRYNSQADVYFYLKKAAGTRQTWGLNYADRFGTTIRGSDDLILYSGGAQGKYLMTGFKLNTAFKLIGTMPAVASGGTCDNTWNGDLTF